MGVKASPSLVLADAGTHPLPCPRGCGDPSPFRHPHVIPRPHLRCSRGEPAPVKTGAGTHHSFSPDHMSFRAQRSGVEESCCPSTHCPRGCGDPVEESCCPSPPLSRGCGDPPLPPLFPQRACPREDGGGNPSLSPPVIPAESLPPAPHRV